MRRYIVSKMAKTYALMNDSAISKHIPKTIFMNKENVGQMLKQYRMVYIKPDIGTFGKGVMKVEVRSTPSKTTYHYQLGVKKHSFESYDSLYQALVRETKNKKYIVQKGVHLNTYKGSPYDIRIMVQKTPRKTWETTGIIGRIAHPKKIVTNFHNGGTLMAFNKLVQQDIAPEKREAYFMKLQKLGRTTATALTKRYPGIREIGIDLGMDHQLKEWILEVNTSPDPYIFKHLRDKKIFSRIMRYRHYNR